MYRDILEMKYLMVYRLTEMAKSHGTVMDPDERMNLVRLT